MKVKVQAQTAFSGRAMRQARRTAGLSAHELGHRIGRTVWQIYRYERGEIDPPLDVISALAVVLKVDLGKLLAPVNGSETG